MIDIPTELMKVHRTGPLEAMATSTLRMDLQHAVCILSLYWGKLSICTTRRRSSRGVYTSGIWEQAHRADVEIRQSVGDKCIHGCTGNADSLWVLLSFSCGQTLMTDWVCYLVQVNQDTCNRVQEAWQLVETVVLPVRLSQIHLLTALNQLCVHQVHVLWADFLAWLQKKSFLLRSLDCTWTTEDYI